MVKIKKIIHWLLLGFISIYIITGYGITQYQFVEKYTFGLLNKALAFKIHLGLIVPFLILLVLHIYFVLKTKPRK